jgi:hypothetical protein
MELITLQILALLSNSRNSGQHILPRVFHMALKVFQFCAEADPQARRYYTILESFNDTILASHKAKLSVSGSPDGPSIFNILFGGTGGQVGFDMASAENSLLPELAQPWAMDEAGLGGAGGSLQVRDGQYDTIVTNGKVAGGAP